MHPQFRWTHRSSAADGSFPASQKHQQPKAQKHQQQNDAHRRQNIPPDEPHKGFHRASSFASLYRCPSPSAESAACPAPVPAFPADAGYEHPDCFHSHNNPRPTPLRTAHRRSRYAAVFGQLAQKRPLGRCQGKGGSVRQGHKGIVQVHAPVAQLQDCCFCPGKLGPVSTLQKVLHPQNSSCIRNGLVR